jgi:hypothetical protein
VIITGGVSPRHLHLGAVIGSQFPGLVKAWLAIKPKRPGGRDVPTPWAGLQPLGDYREAEQEVFGTELRRLGPRSGLQPVAVERIEGEAVLQILDDLKPYFLLILGGPLLSARILGRARGAAVNAHAGWSPELRGAYTTEQALYHRRTDWVGSTVHIATTAADAGPILRRSLTAIYDDDSPAHCFFRTVALGCWLMAEAVGEMLVASEVWVYEQGGRGQTVRGRDFDRGRQIALADDIRAGWLGRALAEERRY